MMIDAAQSPVTAQLCLLASRVADKLSTNAGQLGPQGSGCGRTDPPTPTMSGATMQAASSQRLPGSCGLLPVIHSPLREARAGLCCGPRTICKGCEAESPRQGPGRPPVPSAIPPAVSPHLPVEQVPRRQEAG